MTRRAPGTGPLAPFVGLLVQTPASVAVPPTVTVPPTITVPPTVTVPPLHTDWLPGRPIRMQRRMGLALGATAALLALSGCTSADLGASVHATPSALPVKGWHGTALTEPYAKPSVQLTDMDGHPFRIDQDARRPVVLVVFGYTHCPWVCGQVLGDVATALRPLDPGTRRKVELVFVSVDPRRDDGPALRAYLGRYDQTFIGLTASLPVVRRLGEDLGVAVTGPQSDAEDYTVGHGAQLVGFGPDGLAHLMWMPGTRPADLRADVVRLASTA